MAKLVVLVGVVAFAGSRVVPRMLEMAARLRSRELFTLTVLAIAVTVATASALFFGASMALGYSTRTALVAALGLAQVGEFSFILAGLARDHRLLPVAGYNVIVACAIVSISINPFLFRWLDPLEAATASPALAPAAARGARRAAPRPRQRRGDAGRDETAIRSEGERIRREFAE